MDSKGQKLTPTFFTSGSLNQVSHYSVIKLIMFYPIKLICSFIQKILNEFDSVQDTMLLRIVRQIFIDYAPELTVAGL